MVYADTVFHSNGERGKSLGVYGPRWNETAVSPEYLNPTGPRSATPRKSLEVFARRRCFAHGQRSVWVSPVKRPSKRHPSPSFPCPILKTETVAAAAFVRIEVAARINKTRARTNETGSRIVIMISANRAFSVTSSHACLCARYLSTDTFAAVIDINTFRALFRRTINRCRRHAAGPPSSYVRPEL